MKRATLRTPTFLFALMFAAALPLLAADAPVAEGTEAESPPMNEESIELLPEPVEMGGGQCKKKDQFTLYDFGINLSQEDCEVSCTTLCEDNDATLVLATWIQRAYACRCTCCAN